MKKRSTRSKRTRRARKPVRRMRGGVRPGDILHKLPEDKDYLTYYGKVVDMQGKTVTDEDFLEIDDDSWGLINTRLREHAAETFTEDELIEVGYGGDNGDGTITVKIPEGASNAPGSSVALHVLTKLLGPMIFDLGDETYRMNFNVEFGN
jgi:hypothetical protein